MGIAFYAGSFDPFTNGHLHVIQSACQIFDKVIVGIGINVNKKRNYDIEKMKIAIEKTLEENQLLSI